jgi:hypothetical protein
LESENESSTYYVILVRIDGEKNMGKVEDIWAWPTSSEISTWDVDKQLDYWKNMCALACIYLDEDVDTSEQEVKDVRDYLMGLLMAKEQK